MRHSSNGIRHKPSKLTIGIRVPDGVPNCLSVGTGIHLGLRNRGSKEIVSSNLTWDTIYIESWKSGLIHSPAKGASSEMGTIGSNPILSAIKCNIAQ